MRATSPSIGVLYEHPEWFRPLFAELDRREIRYDRILATDLNFDPSDRATRYALVLNRLSPSAYLRGHGHTLFAGLAYLRHLEIMGVPVINGADAFALELSKTAQISLLARLGLPHPPTRVINVAAQARTPSSLLNTMKRLIAARRSSLAFGRGTIEFLRPRNPRVLAYVRRYQREALLVVRVHEEAGAPILDDLRQTAHPGGDDRLPECEGQLGNRAL